MITKLKYIFFSIGKTMRLEKLRDFFLDDNNIIIGNITTQVNIGIYYMNIHSF